MTKIIDQHISDRFTVVHADNVEAIRGIPDDAIGLTVTSVPFPAMYTYTNTSRDIGNTDGIPQMIDHFRYLAGGDGLLRATMPGRSCCVHLTQPSRFKHRDGVIGRRDFRGDMIRAMEDEGWTYTSEVAIDKDPQLRAVRSKDRGLLFKSLSSDSSVMSPVNIDYMIVFRKPGDNPVPIRAGRSYGNTDGWITEDEWIEWAHGVWYRWNPETRKGIRETDVLNVSIARDDHDERHLCPLQLGVIERCVKLWSAPGDVVCDPFSGIGSTGYRAVGLNRRYIGFELKESYYRQSIKYLQLAESRLGSQRSLFDGIEAAEELEVGS